MKKILFLALLSLSAFKSLAQEYKIITTVESIVPMGLGRSRMTEPQQDSDYKTLTASRTTGTKTEMAEVKRDEIKIDKFEETKLLNFYSATGINFQNIASNDAVISSKLNEMGKDGWQLIFVTSGVESDGGTVDGNGIFVTRYIFKRDNIQSAN